MPTTVHKVKRMETGPTCSQIVNVLNEPPVYILLCKHGYDPSINNANI